MERMLKKLAQKSQRVSKKVVAVGTVAVGATASQASLVTDAITAGATGAETDLGVVFIALIGITVAILVFRKINGVAKSS